MNIALITAGGIGNRMETSVPKQFMTINEKPVIIYTLEKFQTHQEVDAIAVACLEGWETVMRSYANQYSISKLKWIFKGGASNQESIYNVLKGLLKEGCSESDIIIVHDGVRPLVDSRIITDNIRTCMKYGYAVTGLICKEVIMEIDGENLQPIPQPREKLVRTQTPHTYYLGALIQAHKEALKKSLNDTVAPCDMFAKLGKVNQYVVMGSEKNGLKLTKPEDVDIFKAILKAEKHG